MIRRLFTIASALSLLLCIATAALWVRSGQKLDMAIWNFAQGSQLCGCTSRGSFLFCIYRRPNRSPAFDVGFRHVATDTPIEYSPESVSGAGRTVWHVPGFFYLYWKQREGSNFYFVFRGWLLILIFCTLPLIWIVQIRRQAIGNETPTCATCGYDLRASNERCPECGTPIPLKSEATA